MRFGPYERIKCSRQLRLEQYPNTLIKCIVYPDSVLHCINVGHSFGLKFYNNVLVRNGKSRSNSSRIFIQGRFHTRMCLTNSCTHSEIAGLPLPSSDSSTFLPKEYANITDLDNRHSPTNLCRRTSL